MRWDEMRWDEMRLNEMTWCDVMWCDTTLYEREITFCPWGTTLSQIPKSDIVFGHFEIQTFKQNSFKMCDDGMTSKELLERCNLAISGHFHLRDERVYDEGTILYLGNPFQMDFGDVDSTKGYYILDLNTLKYEFTENTISPKHKKIYKSGVCGGGPFPCIVFCVSWHVLVFPYGRIAKDYR